MKVEYLLWYHNSSTWRFKKKNHIGHHSPTSKWSLIFWPQCSLCIMIPHFLHFCSWSLPTSGFVFLIFGSLRSDLSSDHLLFYINQKITDCEYFQGIKICFVCFLNSANTFLICLSHHQTVALNRRGLLHTLQMQETKAPLLCLNQRRGLTSAKENKVYFGFHTCSERNTWVRMGTPRPNKNSAGNLKATGTLKVSGF